MSHICTKASSLQSHAMVRLSHKQLVIRHYSPLLGIIISKQQFCFSKTPVICNQGPQGPIRDITGLIYQVFISARPMKSFGTPRILILFQTSLDYSTFTCRHLSRDFQYFNPPKMSPQCWSSSLSWAYTQALQRQKAISPLFPSPTWSNTKIPTSCAVDRVDTAQNGCQTRI